MMTRDHMSRLSDGIGATVVTSFLSQLQVTTEPGSGLICPGPDPDLADCHVLYTCTVVLCDCTHMPSIPAGLWEVDFKILIWLIPILHYRCVVR